MLSGEALLIVEGERPLRQWDLVHCPPGTKHVIVGAGEGACVVLAVEHVTVRLAPTRAGSRSMKPRSATTPGVEQETTDQEQAYARFAESKRTRYRDGWLLS